MLNAMNYIRDLYLSSRPGTDRPKIPQYQKILNLAAGKVSSSIPNSYNQLIVNVDMCYDQESYGSLSRVLDSSFQGYLTHQAGKTLFIKDDIFNFLNTSPYKYDLIVANRIFEHQFYDSGQIGYLLSSCYGSLETGGKLVFVVPNHKLLAERLVKAEWDDMTSIETAKEVLLFNTEFCNSEGDPHGSIWTPELALYYIGQEGVWDIAGIVEQVLWEGRDCYMMVTLIKR